MTTQLRTDRAGATLVFTLDGSDGRNVLTPAVCAAGIEAFNMAESNREVHSIVVTGACACFSTGDAIADGTAPNGGLAGAIEPSDAVVRWIETLRASPKPVVAAVNGAAAGAACMLALACDLVVASRDSRFTPTADRRGIALPPGLTAHLLAPALSRQQLLEWLWLAPTLSGQQLHALGLVNQLTDSDHVLGAALTLCERLNRLAPAMLAAGKELVNRAPGQSLAAQLKLERELLHTPAATRGTVSQNGAAQGT